MNKNIEKRKRDSVVEKAARIYVFKFEFQIFLIVILVIGMLLAALFDKL